MLPLAYYSQAEHDERTQREGRQEGRQEGELNAFVAALRILLGNRLPERQIEQVAAAWHAHGPPADAMVRVGAVMANPDTWRSLFGDAEAPPRDIDQLPPPKDW